MTIIHHPDDATLLSFSAGSLPTSLAIVVSSHLSICNQCKQRVTQADIIGGKLFDNITPINLPESAKNRLIARLNSTTANDNADKEAIGKALKVSPASEVPLPLQRFIGHSFDSLSWKPLAPGMKQVKIDIGEDEGSIRLIKISSGTCMPLHGHQGSELTMVLRGAYSDEIGCFKVGDVADTDPDIEHQPIVNGNEECICLIATDAPLKFKGIIPRLLQPFFGL